jgi:transcription initiation factor TFIID subunit 2
MDVPREFFFTLTFARHLLIIVARYYDEIKEPMDFRTMGEKLTDGSYSHMEEFAKDIQLVFSNCRKFNSPLTYPVTCPDTVEKAFKKEWAKAMEKKLSWLEKRSLQGLMTGLIKEDMFVSWAWTLAMLC